MYKPILMYMYIETTVHSKCTCVYSVSLYILLLTQRVLNQTNAKLGVD